MTDARFEILGEQTITEIRFLHVNQVTVAASNGSTFERVAIRHPGAVSVLAVHDDAVILIRQYRPATDSHLLEVPAGKLDAPGEDPAATAKRELEEEVGLRPGRVERITGYYTTPGFTDEYMHLYVAHDLEPVPSTPVGPEEEAAEIVAVPVGDIPGMLDRGEIEDAKTVIALNWLLANGA